MAKAVVRKKKAPVEIEAIVGELDAPEAKAVDPLDSLLDEIAAPAASAEDDLDALLDEIAAPEAKAMDPLDSLLDEIAASAASAEDDLDALLDEIAAPEAKAVDPLDSLLDEVVPSPTSLADDLDAIFDEISLPTAKADDSLDDVLEEVASPASSLADDLDAIFDEVSPPTAKVQDSLDDLPGGVVQPAADAQDDLEDRFEEIVIAEEPAPVAPPKPARKNAKVVPAAEPEKSGDDSDAESPSPVAARRSLVRKAVLGLSAVSVLAGTNGLSYYLGTRSHQGEGAQSAHHATTAAVEASRLEEPAPPPLQGLDRYAGLPVEGRIDGKTIFQNQEIREAIQLLDGGEDLYRDVVKASRRYTSVVPIDKSGGVIRIYACSKLACSRDNVKIYYSTNTRRAGVCTTQPYLYGANTSYTYSKSGLREVPNCDRNPFRKGI